VKPDPVFAFHRYYIWANLMRTHFDRASLASPSPEIWSPDSIETTAYMSYWYAGLYVVVTGWRRLRLQDTTIDALLQDSAMVALLEQYRHGVFHFHPEYVDERFLGFLMKGAESAQWARDLNREFGRFFLGYFEQKKKAPG
jgi:hypothetical protein